MRSANKAENEERIQVLETGKWRFEQGVVKRLVFLLL